MKFVSFRSVVAAAASPLPRMLCLLLSLSLAACAATLPDRTLKADAQAASTSHVALGGLDHPASTDGPLPFDPTHLLPKVQTGVDRFLRHLPEADGRGIVVAIFDTGIDPGAPGLAVTSDGRPKIIDLVDASGSGDVDTTTRATVHEDGTITGRSGRTLHPDPSWTNPTGEFRIGLAAAFDLFPGEAMPRVRRERTRAFTERNRHALAKARADLSAFDHDHPKPNRVQLKEREELVARTELLSSHLAEDLPDPGAVYDCIVWHDGERWMAAVDTHEDGLFSNEKALTNFRDCLTYATFPGETLINFAVNIYDDGDTLSIVVDCGNHGTHVAGIVAAHHPDHPELNGIAPGAQLVGVKIGDTRLDSSSHNTSEVRALGAVLRSGAQVINKSYGGASAFPDSGRMADIQRQIVQDHRVVYVASAGNNGPALSTVGSPGGTTSALIGVGATVDPDMARAQYGLPRAAGTMQFTWSSRGPTLDGDYGVDVTAPGGAIAPVANWSLAGSRQMNGTSMSSPSVAGAVALLLSAAHQHDLDPAPEAIKRALQVTASPVPGASPLEVGAGMIDVPRAWQHLQDYAGLDDDEARYELRVDGSSSPRRGVYLRQPSESDRPSEFRVTVAARFPTDHPREALVGFERRITLRSDAAWAQPAESLLLTSGGGSFVLRVEPQELPSGLHVATVFGYDSERPEYGPVFRLPVTVIRPNRVDAGNGWRHAHTLEMKEGDVARHFYAVPDGATWADISLRRLDRDTGQTLILQTVQTREGESFRSRHFREWIGFSEGDETLRSIAVEGGRTLEVAVARNWSGLGDARFAYEIAFRGLRPENSTIAMTGGAGIVGLDVTASFRRERLQPAGRLTHHRRVIAPSAMTDRVLDTPRETLPNGRIPHEVRLDFPLEIDEDGTYKINPAASMQPGNWPNYEGSLWMILDDDGRLVHFGAHADSDIKLAKGTYTLRLQFRHEDPAALAHLRELPLFIDRELPAPVRVHAADTPDAALAGRAMDARVIQPGDTARVWVRVPRHADLPRGVKAGDALLGTMTFGGGGDLVGSATRPGGWPVVMTVSPKAAEDASPKASDAEPADERSEAEKIAEAVRDLKIDRLLKLGKDHDETFDQLEAELLADWPDHLPLRAARLHRLVAHHGDETDAIVQAADAVIGLIDGDELAAHFGRAIDESDHDAQRARRAMTVKRDVLIDALRKKARALLNAALKSESEDDRAARGDAFRSARAELAKWADLDGKEFAMLRMGEARLENRPATALKILRAELAGRPDNRADLRMQRGELLRELNWPHWAERAERVQMLHMPPHAPRF